MPRYEAKDAPKGSLFGGETTSGRTVLLGGLHPDWYVFANGYRLAADSLVKRLTDAGMVKEHVCLPVLFLYRHYVELMLKAMLVDLGELDDTDSTVAPNHQLAPIWKKFTLKLQALGVQHNQDTLRTIGAWILELEALDSGSYSFRYPQTKQGAPSNVIGKTADMTHVYAVMGEIDHVLSGAAAVIDEYLQLKRESIVSGGYNQFYYYG